MSDNSLKLRKLIEEIGKNVGRLMKIHSADLGLKVERDYKYNTSTPRNVSYSDGAFKTLLESNLPIDCAKEGYIFLQEDLNLRGRSVNLPNISIVLVRKANGEWPQVTLGGDANLTENPTQTIFSIMKHNNSVFNQAQSSDKGEWYNERPSVMVIGAKNQEINLNRVDTITFYASSNPATYPSDASIGYSTFNMNFVGIMRFETDPNYTTYTYAQLNDAAKRTYTESTYQPYIQWINENTFNLKRVQHLRISGSYRHNGNLFIGGSFENPYALIHIDNAVNNKFINARLENSPRIHFGPDTISNTIEYSFYTSLSNLTVPYRLTNEGMLNVVRNQALADLQKFTLANYKASETALSTTKAWSPIVSFDVTVEGQDEILVFDFDKQADSRYIITMEFLDSANRALPLDNFNLETSFMTTRETVRNRFRGEGSFGANVYGSRTAVIKTPGVHKVRISLQSKSAAELDRQNYTYFRVDTYRRPLDVLAQ